jgi:hypothetical protein
MVSQQYRKFITWFTRAESPVPLGWFRVAVAIFCIIKMLVFRDSFLDIFGQYGFIQWAITRANLYPGLLHIGDIALWLEKIGINPDRTLYLVLSTYAISLSGLLLGWKTRWMAILAWLINFLWMHAGAGLVYGMDYFTHIALFYCAIMPVGDYLSIDASRDKRKLQPSVAAGVGRKMLQLQMCIVYLSSGLEKAAGIQWWNGEAIWRAVMLPIFHHFDLSWLAWIPWLPKLVGWQTLATESGYALLMWSSKTRWLCLSLILAMHFFIGLLLGMWLFASIMIILNLGAFGAEVFGDLQDLKFFSRNRSKLRSSDL